MSEDDSYYRRKLEVASERDLDSLRGIDAAPGGRMSSPDPPKSEGSSDHVQMDELTARQAQRRHQMSQWGIEFQTSPANTTGDRITMAQPDTDHRVSVHHDTVESSAPRVSNTEAPQPLGELSGTTEVRTPRYVSHHTNYEEMLDSMSPTDPFQGEYIPSGKKKLAALTRSNSSSRVADRRPVKAVSRRSRTLISAEETPGEDNSVPSRTQPPTEVRERKAKRKKKFRSSKSEMGTGTSTETYTVGERSGTFENSAYEADLTETSVKRSHVKKLKKTKRHSDVPNEKPDSMESVSVKSNGTYTVPRADSRTQLLSMSSMSRLSGGWRKQKKQSKMELSRVNTGLSAVKSSQNQKALSEFVTSNFVQCECNHYVKSTDKGDGTACVCGHSEEWHVERGLTVSGSAQKEFWHPRNHTEKMPCDSFGEICFQGFGNECKESPYLRLDPAIDLDKVWTVLTKHWMLPYPTLLISVTGGAQSLNLKSRMQTVFQHGLIHAATSTGAWIITGGTNAGVMKVVGQAVKDYLLTADTSEQTKLVALGIVSWGVVANKDALDGEGDRGLFPAVYNIEDAKERGRMALLDPNHTHFLLVDNGTEGKYGQEIEFRSALENYISKRVETGVAEGQSVNVPVVLLVLEGGQNTLKTVWESVRNRTPVVVIQGSGRAADIIAQAYKLTKNSSNEDVSSFPAAFNSIAMNLTKRDFVWGTRDEATIERDAGECVKQLREILQHRNLINVFDIDDADSKDIDKCILYALLKANKTNPQSQLALALAWNRSDIARQKIFTYENRVHWQKLNLYDAMFTALVQDRLEFVQLFIDHGVDLKRLSIVTLWNLYANAVKDPPNNCAQLLIIWISYYNQSWKDYLCCRTAENPRFGEDLLAKVGKVIQQLLGEQGTNIYGDRKFTVTTSSRKPSLKWEGKRPADIPDGGVFSRQHVNRRKALRKKYVQEFEFAERELFIWAILLNRRKLANLFWRMGKDHIGGALMAASLLRAMSKAADDEEEIELSLDLMDHANHFESLAVAVLSECYNKDKRMAHMLLVRELNSWGKTTLFSLADSGMLMDFMEHTCCQTKLNMIWKGCMAQYTPSWKIFVAMFMPLLVPAIKFTDNDSPMEDLDGDNDVPLDEAEEEVIDTDPRVSVNKVTPKDSQDDVEFAQSKTRQTKKRKRKKFFHVGVPGGEREGESGGINIISAVYYFYTAPATKFYCNLISYFTFLGIFSVFILTDLHPVSELHTPSILEYITWGWAGTLAIEEVRQIFTRDPRSFKYKIASWFGSEWNRLDFIMYSMLLLSILLRLVLRGASFFWARLTYTITITLFFLRSMQYFYVNKNMGPKVIMIKKMLTDLLFFFFILVVFVVSFGVAYTANLYPNSDLSWNILRNVVYLPYWQMYGELFLEDVEGDMPEGSCSYNSSIYHADDDLERCPEKTWVVPVLAAIYLLLTNILLVNLLIAMFSYTFERVQENSEKVWRYYRYSLIFEYYDRPSFVPPLIILTHIFRVFKFLIVKRPSGTQRKADAFRRILSPDDNQRYTALEKAAMEKYTTKAILFAREKMDYMVQSTADRLEQVMGELESIKDQVMQEGGEKEEAVVPVAAHALISAEHPRVQEEIGKLNRRLNQVTDQLSMQSERLDSVLTLLVGMSRQGSAGQVWTTPQQSGSGTVEIHDLPGSLPDQ